MNSGLSSCTFFAFLWIFVLNVNSYEIACRHAYKGYSLSCRFNYLDDNKTLTEDLPNNFKSFTKYITHATLGISNLTTIPADTFDVLPNLHTLVSRADIRTLTTKQFLNATKLVMLNFGYNNQLEKLESYLFKHVPTLEYIDLGYNQISSIEDGTFHGLTNLKTLYLEANAIEVLTNATFTGAQNLRLLDVSRNQIHDIANGSFANMSKLRTLQLNRNQIEILQSTIFEGLAAIERIDLSINRIAEIEEGAFDNLSTLKFLELGFNRLTTLPDTMFYGLTGLKTLFLGYNRLQDIDYVFANVTQLKLLDLSYNPLETMSIDFLSNMQNLQSLELRGCNLTELDDDQFNEQINLEILDLSENNLTSIDLMIFDPLDKLQILKLASNRLTEVNNITEIKMWMPSINFMNLSGNEIDCDIVHEIIDYFNKNDIEYEFGEEVEVGCELVPFSSRNIQAYELSHAEFIEQNKLTDKLNDNNNLNMEH